MVIELLLGIVLSIAGMVVVGTFVRQLLNLRSGINWFFQTVAIFGISVFFSFGSLVSGIMVAIPTVIHLLRFTVAKILDSRIRSGAYGEPAMWAYELIEEEDDKRFIQAQHILSESEVREVSIIAESKDEMRDLMIERYNQTVSENVNTNADKI